MKLLQQVSFATVTFLLAEHSTASARAEMKDAPSVVITFDGGKVSENIRDVLNVLELSGVSVSSEPSVLKKGETVCSALLHLGYPEPCNPMLQVVARINGRSEELLATVAAGETILFPSIFLSTRKRETTRYRTEETGTYMENITKNWSHFQFKVDGKIENKFVTTVTYVQYEAVVAAKTAQLAHKGYDSLIESDLQNISISLRGIGGSTIKLNSGPSTVDKSLIENACKQGITWSDVDYSDYIDMDADAVHYYSDARKDNTLTKINVMLMDGPLSPAGNLYPTLGAGALRFFSTKTCGWVAFEQLKNHANLMAGIIASQRATGFVGIWPRVNIKPFNLFEDIGRVMENVAYYLQSDNDSRPDVYLFASSIEPIGTETYWNNPDARLRTSEGSAIENFLNIVVTAAPPVENGNALVVNAQLRKFPQNFGDNANVIVVTACEDCTRGAAKLTERAGVSNPEEGQIKFVHVAAPTGTVTGWVGDTEIASTDGGTSQAAAYVAGMVAGMIAKYPTYYAYPPIIKYRVQICSWPLPSFRGGQVNEEVGKIAAGVVDPGVCLLDPSKTWLKRGNGWEPIDFAHWEKDVTIDRASPSNALRLMRVAGASPGSTEWRVYSKRENRPSPRRPAKGLGSINQIVDAQISANAALVTCAGERIKLSDVSDLLFVTTNNPGDCPAVAEDITSSPVK
ncbi:S8 family serine peptidase [Rhizobium yanglingense]